MLRIAREDTFDGYTLQLTPEESYWVDDEKFDDDYKLKEVVEEGNL